ncbi:TPA: ATP-grasp domain-containing protein [Streptococcus suis]
MKPVMLFPSDVFQIKQVDEELQAEYEAAKEYFEVLLFDNLAWFEEGKLRLSKKVDVPQTCIYRGWMMKPEVYRNFFNQLSEQGLDLLTRPTEYEALHLFPKVYPLVKEDTASILVYPEGQRPNVIEIREHFTEFMLKDYVKSVKGAQIPSKISSGIHQDELEELLATFYRLRGNLFTGGICLKEILPLKYYGSKTNEYRMFICKNSVVSISQNSQQSTSTLSPPKELIEKYRNLPSPFYTVDVAELEDGMWKVLETGDGQVSGLSFNQDYSLFFKTLSSILS